MIFRGAVTATSSGAEESVRLAPRRDRAALVRRPAARGAGRPRGTSPAAAPGCRVSEPHVLIDGGHGELLALAPLVPTACMAHGGALLDRWWIGKGWHGLP